MIFLGDWYWSVGGRLYASARNIYVPGDDAALLAWQAAGGAAPRIASEAELWDVLQAQLPGRFPDWLFNGATFVQPGVNQYTSVQLVAYAAAARYAKETGGITTSGIMIDTSRAGQALITGAWATVQAQPSATIQWKAADGTWAALNATQITAVATAVTNHVQACFAAEAALDAAINAAPPTVTSKAQIDAAFAAVTA